MKANKLLVLAKELVDKLQAAYKKDAEKKKKLLNRLKELQQKLADFEKMKNLNIA